MLSLSAGVPLSRFLELYSCPMPVSREEAREPWAGREGKVKWGAAPGDTT